MGELNIKVLAITKAEACDGGRTECVKSRSAGQNFEVEDGKKDR